MIKTPLNLAMLGDPQAQQFCEMLSLSKIFAPLTDPGCVAAESGAYLMTESGDNLTTEAGDKLVTE